MFMLRFPQVLDDSRIDSYVVILRSIKKDHPVLFDLKETILISPAGLAILTSLFETVLEQGCDIQWSVKRRLVKSYPFIDQLISLNQKGNRLPDPALYHFESDTLLLAGYKNVIDLGLMEKFEAKFLPNEDLFFDCKLILQELMQNTVSHSGAERYLVYAGLWEREIHCGVLDRGVTIPAKLRQKYSRDNDIDYLLLAMEEGSTTRRERTGGLGLFYFREFLKRNSAKLTIVSGNAQVRFYFRTRKSQKSLLKHHLPGTWCFARLPYLKRR